MDLSDIQLLRRYFTDQAEDAFTELVRRHFSLVYGTATRQVAGDAELARDVTQTVFADLARKARTLADRPSLAGWLYTSTQFAAANLVRGEKRRRLREQKALAMQEAHAEPELNWDHLRPAIDRALQELAADDREAVLLRYFEQREFRAVGEVFGVSDEVARKRVGRALDKLREILSRHGLTSTTTSLAAALEGQVMPPVPAHLVAAIAGGALAASAKPAVGAAFIQLMMTKPVLIALSAVALVGTLTSISAHRTLHQLRAEKERALRSVAAASSAPASLDLSELEQLRGEHAELIRLRGEVARLRQDALEAAARPRAAAQAPPRAALLAAPTDQFLEPVQVFVATADANVGPGQGLVFGGWATKPGKRMLIFVEPSLVVEPAAAGPPRLPSIQLQGKFVEVPDDTITEIGLDALKSESKATSSHALLGPGQIREILKTLEQTAGVDILSSPRVQTGQGTPASLSITELRTVAGQEYSIGPTLDVEPRVAADGSSVNLTISARFRKVTGE